MSQKYDVAVAMFGSPDLLAFLADGWEPMSGSSFLGPPVGEDKRPHLHHAVHLRRPKSAVEVPRGIDPVRFKGGVQ